MGTKLTKEEFRNTLRDTLFRVDEFCKEHNISYSLAYGTALGAVRHKGIIPWDDDIDIFMFRSDYERFESLWLAHEQLSNEHYKLWGELKEDNYFCGLWAKFFDTNTVLIERFSGSNQAIYGAFIDIFILDDIPGTAREQIKVLKKHKFYSKMIRHFSKHGKRWNHFCKRFPIPLPSITTMIRLLISNRERAKIEGSNYVSNFSDFPFGREKCVFPREYFKAYTAMEFEGRPLPIMEGWDAYLKQMYGDYMQFPPKEEQVGHNVEIYWAKK